MTQRDYLTTGNSPLASTEGAGGASLERSSDEIREHIAATRESITETVDELSSRVQRTFDWKTYVADYPLAATGIAAGLGLVLGYVAHRRAAPEERIKEALAEMMEDTTSRFQGYLDGLRMQDKGVGQMLGAIATTALLKAAGDFARRQFAACNAMQERGRGDATPNTAYHQARGY